MTNERKDQLPGQAERSVPAQPDGPASSAESPQRTGMREEQWEMIEFCVRTARLFGIPKSVGEIFGFVFCSSTPVAFENIVAGLGISGGSASHGLKFLRQLGALKLTYVARDRRDFYVPETSARRLFAGFLSENILHEAKENRQLIDGVCNRLSVGDRNINPVLLGRAKLLMGWAEQGSTALRAAMNVLDA